MESNARRRVLTWAPPLPSQFAEIPALQREAVALTHPVSVGSYRPYFGVLYYVPDADRYILLTDEPRMQHPEIEDLTFSAVFIGTPRLAAPDAVPLCDSTEEIRVNYKGDIVLSYPPDYSVPARTVVCERYAGHASPHRAQVSGPNEPKFEVEWSD